MPDDEHSPSDLALPPANTPDEPTADSSAARFASPEYQSVLADLRAGDLEAVRRLQRLHGLPDDVPVPLPASLRTALMSGSNRDQRQGNRTAGVSKTLGQGAKSLKTGATKLAAAGGQLASKGAAGGARLAKEGTSAARDSVVGKRDDPDAFQRERTPILDLTNHQPPISAVALTGTALALASMSVLNNTTAILQFTRPLADSDHAFAQQVIQKWLPAATNPDVSRFMDTVPGADYAGGMFHRIFHGHDLSALTEITKGHGVDGFATWLNHVLARDAFTPAGIPWLPFGSGEVHALLVELGFSKSLAATFLSINAASVAGLALALVAGNRLRRAVKLAREHKAAQHEYNEALVAIDARDLTTARERFERALAKPGATNPMRLMAALTAVDAARLSDDTPERRKAAGQAGYWLRDFISKTPSTASLPLWANASVSTPALASLVYGQALMLGDGDDPPADNEIDRLRSGIAAAKTHAAQLLEPPKRGPFARPQRPLSAAVNYVIALDTTLSYPARLMTSRETVDELWRDLQRALTTAEGTELEVVATSARAQLEHRYAVAPGPWTS